MSRDPRKPFGLPPRDRDRDRVVWGRSDYRRPLPPRSPNRKRSRSRSPLMRTANDNVRSRSPRRSDKDLLDENILSEISKLPEPSELWDNQQHQDSNFASAPPPPSFQQETVNPSYPNYQPSYSGIYNDFPSMASVPQAQIPPEIASWNQMSLPPPPVPTTQSFVNNIEDQIKKEAAIESEMRHQKAALSKQREDYIKKAGILKKELDTLKDQRNELRGDAKRSPSPDTKRFLKENTKLQLEIQNKLKTINNVVDMLNGIIGEGAHEVVDSDDSERTSKPRKSRSPSGKKFNYVYYDPEMHWCRVCNEFPPTAKDYLNHLHSPAHHKMAAAHMEAPWHSVSGVNEGFPSYPSAPTKRTPIRGLQFFVPSTAWYCKLCDQFIGDLHCASAHLKSTVHSKNYTNFVEQNPHWETDWMSDRQKAFEKAQGGGKGKALPVDKPQQYTSHTITFHKDGFHSKQRKGGSPPPVAEKKRKKEKKRKSKRKRSSSDSSSSQSSSSDSEREKKKKKKIKKEKERFQPDEKALTEWMSSIQMERLNESDRKLLDNIKSRLKKEKESKRRSPERPVRVRESSVDSRKTIEIERREQSSRERRVTPRSPRPHSPRTHSPRTHSPRPHSPRTHSPRPHSPRTHSPRPHSPRRPGAGARARRRKREQSRQRSPSTTKKPDIRKMPFIGKMPVYKSLGLKSKTDEQKKEDEKKKEDDEASKKRREEMDAEIQKKVAEFKEKIARAQLERQAQVELPPPGMALPQALAAPPPQPPPPAYMPQPAPPATAPPTPQPTLPKDFQEALDIIFPTPEMKQELSATTDGLLGFPPPFSMSLGMPQFSLPGLLPTPQMPQLPMQQMQQMPPGMFPFDLNAPLFQHNPHQPRPQLYDTHVPLVPSPKPQQHRQNQNQNQNQNRQNKNNRPKLNHNKIKPLMAETLQPPPVRVKMEKKENGAAAAKKEEMDDLAMLGIDASDVGANV